MAEAESATPIEDWLAVAASEAGLDGFVLDPGQVRALLDLARDAAHAVERPAAPLTTFLAGVAVGRGAELTVVIERLSALAQGRSDGAE